HGGKGRGAPSLENSSYPSVNVDNNVSRDRCRLAVISYDFSRGRSSGWYASAACQGERDHARQNATPAHASPDPCAPARPTPTRRVCDTNAQIPHSLGSVTSKSLIRITRQPA